MNFLPKTKDSSKVNFQTATLTKGMLSSTDFPIHITTACESVGLAAFTSFRTPSSLSLLLGSFGRAVSRDGFLASVLVHVRDASVLRGLKNGHGSRGWPHVWGICITSFVEPFVVANCLCEYLSGDSRC